MLARSTDRSPDHCLAGRHQKQVLVRVWEPCVLWGGVRCDDEDASRLRGNRGPESGPAGLEKMLCMVCVTGKRQCRGGGPRVCPHLQQLGSCLCLLSAEQSHCTHCLLFGGVCCLMAEDVRFGWAAAVVRLPECHVSTWPSAAVAPLPACHAVTPLSLQGP